MKNLEKQRKEYIFEQIAHLDRKWQYISSRRMHQVELTGRQHELLNHALHSFGYPPSIKELSEKIGSTHQNIKQLVTSLAKHAYVELIRDSHDKRILRVSVTPAGEEAIKKSAMRFGRLLYDLFHDFEPEEVRKLFDLLVKIDNRTDDLLEKTTKN